jgi:hypothetical protein
VATNIVTFLTRFRIISINQNQTDMAHKLTVTFSECEHDGDLDNYKEDIIKCGGKILSSSLDSDEETGTVVFEVEDKIIFRNKFIDTDTWEFVC